MVHYIWLVLLSNLITKANTEVYTSVVELERLPETLKKVIFELDNHIKMQEKKLYVLNRYIDRYKREHDESMQNIPDYLENPIKVFILIKQLTSDLDSLKRTMKLKSENATKIHKYFKYPELNDLIGAASGIARLQNTYELNVKDLSKGNLSNFSFRPPMTAGDCYALGKILLNKGTDIANGLPWMTESLHKYYNERNIYPFDEDNIIQHITKTYDSLGNTKRAFQWIDKLLTTDHQNLEDQKNMMYSEQNITEEIEMKKMMNEIKKRGRDQYIYLDSDLGPETYEASCRGDLVVPVNLSSRFSCRYFTEKYAFLKIAPIKMEVVYLNPDIILFYEMLSENEMKLLKQIARPRLHRSQLTHPETGDKSIGEQRTSKVTWILDTEYDTITHISRRVKYITNLQVERTTAEPLQVSNYGVGGHFEPHWDFPPDVRRALSNDNRIATVMFYISDVAQGGATVFPKLGLSVQPVEGTAIYWSNLDGAGQLDAATMHAGCPVLLGSKWVGVIWIHENGQKDIEQCKAGYQMENHKIHSPVSKTSRDRRLYQEYKKEMMNEIMKAVEQTKYCQQNDINLNVKSICEEVTISL